MKFKLEDPVFVFDTISNLYLLKDEEEESWKRGCEDEEVQRLRKRGGIQYSPIELPFPMNFAVFSAGRINDFYSACLSLAARDSKIYEGVSKLFKKILRENSYDFFPTLPDGAGYVLKDGQTFLGIIEGGKGFIRGFNIGRGGSYPRSGEDKIEFCKDLSCLVGITNLFLDACFSLNGKGFKLERLPDIILHLTP
jgi:hypothetical protein